MAPVSAAYPLTGNPKKIRRGEAKGTLAMSVAPTPPLMSGVSDSWRRATHANGRNLFGRPVTLSL